MSTTRYHLSDHYLAVWLIIFVLAFPYRTMAQSDSCQLRISLLTVAPGEELYSTFGHSALRITDSVNHTDIVYNYGTFFFGDPDFYTKFIRGKLLYYVSTDSFNSFQEENQGENRSMIEQVLDLSCKEKRQLVRLLSENMQPQNRFYKYDFLFDNCTTRLRDLLEKATDSTIRFGKVIQKETSFRDLIHEYLDYGDKQWSKLGIDLLLGGKTDAVATPYEIMFLPDYLMKTLDSSSLGAVPIVNQKQSLYRIDHSQITKNNLTHPFFLFTCLLVILAFLSFSKKPLIQRTLSSLDGLLFFLAGLLGILFIFMWWGTDHIMCRNNYNLLWAWPTHLIAAFYVHSNKKWAKGYFLLYAICNIGLLLCWTRIPQHLNAALIPILIILIFRSLIYLFKKKP